MKKKVTFSPTTTEFPPPREEHFLTNLAGGQNGSFFKIVPPFIYRNNKPGCSILPKPTVMDWVWEAVTLRGLYASPNLVWSVMALAVYFIFPYDLSSSSSAALAPLSFAFFAARFPIWFFLTFGYTLFWHVSLYGLGWAERPFIANEKYNYEKVAHNVFYSLSGVLIWTCFDNVFAFLWATGRLTYLSDAVAFSSVSGFIRFVAGLVMVPLWRDVHFYFAHRFLHYKPLFRQVHSLHHRNTSIEPFAGLCMHPVEHLYYYACVLPSLVFFASPFHFLWNGVHLLLSPGASHSGYEDHFQADNFHYMHHRYFECNYSGFSASALDVIFNTFQERFKDVDMNGASPRDDSKSTLRALPTLEFTTYLALSTACVGVWAMFTGGFGLSAGSTPVTKGSLESCVVAIVAGFGPAVVAFFMAAVTMGTKSLLEPFADKPFSQNALHVFLGSLFCAVPVSWMAYLAF